MRGQLLQQGRKGQASPTQAAPLLAPAAEQSVVSLEEGVLTLKCYPFLAQ
jgi:hypothetical protein